MDLSYAFMPEATRGVADAIGQEALSEGMTLVGGTALAIQLGHRLSEDLDFAFMENTLPKKRIDALLGKLKMNGHDIQFITDPSAIQTHKINTGEDLLGKAQDYVIDGVKVTFFVLPKTDAQKAYYQGCNQLKSDRWGFDVMGLDGLRFNKSLILGERVRSRDLYDLWSLMKADLLGVGEVVNWARSYGHPNNDSDYFQSVLRGEIPLDEDDEGLNQAGVETSFRGVVELLKARVDAYRVDEAEKAYPEQDPSSAKGPGY